jgi:hypothetical protein
MGASKTAVALFCFVVSLLAAERTARADWAIAFGQHDGGYGWGQAHNYASREHAISHALRECRQHSHECRLIAQGSGGCAALAVTFRSNGWGYSTGSN